MRNPNRTTKAERRAVRASNPMVCRTMGIAAAARLQRQRSMRPESAQLDRLTRALGLETLMTESTQPGVNHWSAPQPDAAALAEQYRDWVLNGEMRSPSGRFRAMRGWAGGVTIIDDPNPDDVPYPTVESVTVEPDGWLTLKYAPHISLGAGLTGDADTDDNAVGLADLHEAMAQFQRNVLPGLIAHPDDDNEES
jgi:hypothetical protein